jgi:hypothetical protein
METGPNSPPPLPPRDPPPLPPRHRPLPAPPVHDQPPWQGALQAVHWRQDQYIPTIKKAVRGDTKGLCWALVHRWIEHGGSLGTFRDTLSDPSVKKELVEYHDAQYGGLLDDELLQKKGITPMAMAWKGAILQHGDTSWLQYLTRNPCLCHISLGSGEVGIPGHSIGTRVTGTTARFFDPNCGEFTFSRIGRATTFELRLCRLLYHTGYDDLLGNVVIRKYALPKRLPV